MFSAPKMGIVPLVLIGGAVAYFAIERDPSDGRILTATESRERQEQERKELGNVALEKFTWRADGFGNVLSASFTLRNSNTFAIKDVRVRCETAGNSGTVIGGTTQTVYETVPANGSRTIRNMNFGFIHSQSTGAGCRVLGYARV